MMKVIRKNIWRTALVLIGAVMSILLFSCEPEAPAPRTGSMDFMLDSDFSGVDGYRLILDDGYGVLEKELLPGAILSAEDVPEGIWDWSLIAYLSSAPYFEIATGTAVVLGDSRTPLTVTGCPVIIDDPSYGRYRATDSQGRTITSGSGAFWLPAGSWYFELESFTQKVLSDRTAFTLEIDGTETVVFSPEKGEDGNAGTAYFHVPEIEGLEGWSVTVDGKTWEGPAAGLATAHGISNGYHDAVLEADMGSWGKVVAWSGTLKITDDEPMSMITVEGSPVYFRLENGRVQRAPIMLSDRNGRTLEVDGNIAWLSDASWTASLVEPGYSPGAPDIGMTSWEFRPEGGRLLEVTLNYNEPMVRYTVTDPEFIRKQTFSTVIAVDHEAEIAWLPESADGTVYALPAWHEILPGDLDLVFMDENGMFSMVLPFAAPKISDAPIEDPNRDAMIRLKGRDPEADASLIGIIEDEYGYPFWSIRPVESDLVRVPFNDYCYSAWLYVEEEGGKVVRFTDIFDHQPGDVVERKVVDVPSSGNGQDLEILPLGMGVEFESGTFMLQITGPDGREEIHDEYYFQSISLMEPGEYSWRIGFSVEDMLAPGWHEAFHAEGSFVCEKGESVMVIPRWNRVKVYFTDTRDLEWPVNLVFQNGEPVWLGEGNSIWAKPGEPIEVISASFGDFSCIFYEIPAMGPGPLHTVDEEDIRIWNGTVLETSDVSHRIDGAYVLQKTDPYYPDPFFGCIGKKPLKTFSMDRNSLFTEIRGQGTMLFTSGDMPVGWFDSRDHRISVEAFRTVDVETDHEPGRDFRYHVETDSPLFGSFNVPSGTKLSALPVNEMAVWGEVRDGGRWIRATGTAYVKDDVESISLHTLAPDGWQIDISDDGIMDTEDWKWSLEGAYVSIDPENGVISVYGDGEQPQSLVLRASCPVENISFTFSSIGEDIGLLDADEGERNIPFWLDYNFPHLPDDCILFGETEELDGAWGHEGDICDIAVLAISVKEGGIFGVRTILLGTAEFGKDSTVNFHSVDLPDFTRVVKFPMVPGVADIEVSMTRGSERAIELPSSFSISNGEILEVSLPGTFPFFEYFRGFSVTAIDKDGMKLAVCEFPMFDDEELPDFMDWTEYHIHVTGTIEGLPAGDEVRIMSGSFYVSDDGSVDMDFMTMGSDPVVVTIFDGESGQEKGSIGIDLPHGTWEYDFGTIDGSEFLYPALEPAG